MNLTKRSRWLTAVAALVAGWVIFSPKDPDAVEATAGTAVPAAHAAHAAAAHPAPPVAGALLALANRVVDQTAASALFASHSWYVAPPPPPPAPVVQTAPEPPPKPVAPPLPYSFIGSFKPDGQREVFFLSNGDRVYDVHVGDTLDNTYSVDSFSNGRLVLTYKPLNQQQQLQIGVGQ